ncbi:MAG: type II toxin-antitoxin system RatA family toxin, partial [Gammaproteobacteria bacterium]
MQEVVRSVIVPYSAQEMFALAGDVANYKQFLPWCSDSEILERADSEVLARIEISYKGWHTAFTTRNRLVPGELIEMRLVEGSAFESLEGDWRFREIDEMA